MILKNNDSISHIWGGLAMVAGSTATIDNLWSMSLFSDSAFLNDLSLEKAQVIDGQNVLSMADAVGFLSGSNVKADVVKTTPFAEPLFRTCRDKSSAIETLIMSETKTVIHQVTAERYLTGGSMVYEGAMLGDWIEGFIYDGLGIIPEAYRAATCEAWPVVSKYVIGQYVKPGNGEMIIDTYPLNAKISAGLQIGLTYHSSTAVGTRSFGVNYHLSKKL